MESLLYPEIPTTGEIAMEIKETLLYKNPLASEKDIKDFRIEGSAAVSFPRQALRLENSVERNATAGIHGNFLFWCNEHFPDNIAIRWQFKPLTDNGLAMVWLATHGRNGKDLFDPSLPPRDGDYPQYHSGAIEGLHISYFRRNLGESSFRTCNLRKSYGFHLVAQGGDPLPDVIYANKFYQLEVMKQGAYLRFAMEGVVLFDWFDDENHGPILSGGKIGFRQMAGLIAEYRNLEVYTLA